MKKKSVLYAEDEFTNRKIMEIQCMKFGVDCTLAENGMEALELCINNNYDLVILDQYMPGLNGDEVAMELNSRKSELTLIAITSDDSCTTKLKTNGFKAVFVKPLKASDYKEILENYL